MFTIYIVCSPFNSATHYVQIFFRCFVVICIFFYKYGLPLLLYCLILPRLFSPDQLWNAYHTNSTLRRINIFTYSMYSIRLCLNTTFNSNYTFIFFAISKPITKLFDRCVQINISCEGHVAWSE